MIPSLCLTDFSVVLLFGLCLVWFGTSLVAFVNEDPQTEKKDVSRLHGASKEEGMRR